MFVTYGVEALNWLESKTKGDSDVKFNNIAMRTTNVAMETNTRG